jgi:hypothetical protein
MKLGKTTIAGTSIALLVIQLAIVSTIAAKYLYQRLTCPRVWTRARVYDPELLLRGRYLSEQLMVDGCQSTLPSAELARMPRDKDGVPTGKVFSVNADGPVRFTARILVKNNKLIAIRIPEPADGDGGQQVAAWPGSTCAEMRLDMPVDFYIPEHADVPTNMGSGQELWMEVTVPPKGPPRPVQLALKDHGVWKPLAIQ